MSAGERIGKSLGERVSRLAAQGGQQTDPRRRTSELVLVVVQSVAGGLATVARINAAGSASGIVRGVRLNGGTPSVGSRIHIRYDPHSRIPEMVSGGGGSAGSTFVVVNALGFCG